MNMVGMPRAGPGVSPAHSSLPVSSSYARTFPSPPAWKTSPVLVTRMPFRAPTPPVPLGPPAATVGGWSPGAICHLISPVFRSYAVSVVYGGLVAVASTLYPVMYRVGGTTFGSISSGHGELPALPPTPG